MTGVLPPGWTVSTLERVASWGSGGTPKRSEHRYYGGDIPWAVIGDLNDGTITECGEFITQDGLDNSSCKLVEPGTVLVAMYGSIGKLGIAGMQMTTNQAIAFANSHLDRNYLFYYLLSQRHALTKAGKGATQLNISQTVLKPWPIPVAPFAEQGRIVAAIEEYFSRLDAASAAITAAQARIEALRRSVLAEAFAGRLVPQDPTDEPASALLERIAATQRTDPAAQGSLSGPAPSPMTSVLPPGWALTTLGELFTPRKGKDTPDSLDRRPYLSLDNIESHTLRITAWERSSGYSSQSSQLFAGDVAYARLRPYLNKVALIDREALGSAEFIVLPRMPEILPGFLCYRLLSHDFVKFADQHSTGDRPRLKWAQMRCFSFGVPPVAEQGRIVAAIEEYFSRLDAASAAITAAQARIEALRRSVLAEAFAGRLVPQDPTDEPASALLERITAAQTADPSR